MVQGVRVKLLLKLTTASVVLVLPMMPKLEVIISVNMEILLKDNFFDKNFSKAKLRRYNKLNNAEPPFQFMD